MEPQVTARLALSLGGLLFLSIGAGLLVDWIRARRESPLDRIRREEGR